MTLLLMFWVCGSIVICLALLSVAARRVPRMDEQMAAGYEPALQQAGAVALRKAKTVYPSSWAEPSAPPPPVGAVESVQAQAAGPSLSLRASPDLPPGMGRGQFSPPQCGGKPGHSGDQIRVSGVRSGVRAATQSVPRRRGVTSEETVELIGAIYD